MSVPQFVDISAFQPANIDWQAYKKWASQWDGIARVSMRSTYGTGFTDQHFHTYRNGALTAGVDVIIYYHYAYPSLNSPIAEADYQHSIVGNTRSQDVLMLDYEEGVNQATAQWAYEWLARQEQNYGGKLPTIYASDGYIRARLQDSRLARYPLTLADWQFTPNERPACPLPWDKYTYLQYTDRAINIPGIAGKVDANIFFGGHTVGIPSTWKDNGTTLTAPNGVPVVLGFRDYLLSHPWDSGNVPIAPEYHLDSLEESNPSLGAGQKIVFLFGDALEYTLARGVFRSWNGKEYDFIRNAKNLLESQVATLQLQLQAYQGQAQKLATLKQEEATIESDIAAIKATLDT